MAVSVCYPRNAPPRHTARLMACKLVMAAAKTWRRLKGENQLPKVVGGVTLRHASTGRRPITASSKSRHGSRRARLSDESR